MADKKNVWHDILDVRKALEVDDLEAGLKEPEYDNVVIPEHLGTVQELLDDHKIKRYAFEVNDYLPWSFDASTSPWGKRVAQAGLFTNDLVQMFTLTYAPSKVIGLHTDAELTFHNPAFIDEVVTLDAKYVDKFIRRGQGCVELEATVTGEDGRPIVDYHGIEILKTIPGDIAGRSTAKPERRVTGEIPENPHYINKITKDVQVNDVIEPTNYCIMPEQAAVFSRVGDFIINIHNNLQQARVGNLRVPLVQGAQHFCTLTVMLENLFGADFFKTGWLKCKFIAPIDVFVEYETSGIVTEIEDLGNGKKKVNLDIWIRRHTDGRLSEAGWASCIIDA